MATAFKIERGVPMPTFKKVKEIPPVDQMQIGDSMIIEAKGAMGATNKLQNTARRRGLPHKYKSALVSPGVYRVWRIS